MPSTQKQFKDPYYKGPKLTKHAISGERAMTSFLKPNKLEKSKPLEHRLRPYKLLGAEGNKYFVDLLGTDQVEVDLLNGETTKIKDKMQHALEEKLHAVKAGEDEDEKQGAEGESPAEIEKLIENIIAKLAMWLENKFRDQALLIKKPEQIKDVNERGDLNLYVTNEFLAHIEEDFRNSNLQLEMVGSNTKKLEIQMLNGEKLKIIFIAEEKFEQQAANNNDSFAVAM